MEQHEQPRQQLSTMPASSHTTKSLSSSLEAIPKLIDRGDVKQMLSLQTGAIDRLESTNIGLANSNTISQKKLATTMKLFKKTARQISDSKRDLDVIYKKISDLKNNLRVERPDLFQSQVRDTELAE